MLRVMLVDDELWCLKELSDFVTSAGGAVIVGQHLSGREALSSVDKERPNIAFIDVVMPGMTGLELAKKLKKQMQELKVVLVSEDKSYALQAFDIGVDDFILKPVRFERILKVLERVR